MMPSRSAHSTVTGVSRALIASSSGRRSARRARLATLAKARGLRIMLGTASLSITGSTRVACRSGQMSPGKCSPQSHSGRWARAASRLPCFHAEPPIEFTSTSDRTVRGSRRRDGSRPRLEGWPTTTTLVNSDGVEELGGPVGVSGQRELGSGQFGRTENRAAPAPTPGRAGRRCGPARRGTSGGRGPNRAGRARADRRPPRRMAPRVPRHGFAARPPSPVGSSERGVQVRGRWSSSRRSTSVRPPQIPCGSRMRSA